MRKKARKIHMISLGCPKNLVDSENLLGMLTERGAEATSEANEADTIIINTCGFIHPAVEEGIETILEAARLKETGGLETLVVTGCLSQRYHEEFSESLPEVDVFWGTGGLDSLVDFLTTEGPDRRKAVPPYFSPGFALETPGPRLRAAPFYRAYLKISEGCSNACTYCLIPSLRGRQRSRPLETLIREAESLAESGVRELILTAQDTTAYGRDLSAGENLADLLRALVPIPGLAWIRLMYAYPSGLNKAVLKVMADEPRICPYLDLPLQHASPRILKRMGRKGATDLTALIDRLRSSIPGLTLRTTMMVGFPGETQEDFDILLEFVTRARFEHLGGFKFSPEEGARAAHFPDQVPQRIKENRRRKLMAVQRRISRELNRRLRGRTLPVLIEGVSQETELLLTGRTQGQAPEIDGQVYINEGTASAGEIRPVLITESHDYDLVGRIVD